MNKLINAQGIFNEVTTVTTVAGLSTVLKHPEPSTRLAINWL